MNLILSLKPQFAQKILDGSKLYEYRKRIFTRKDVDKVYVYATKPICKIVGCFRVEEVIEDTKTGIWAKTHIGGGISKAYFDDYFLNSDIAYAIKIGQVVKLDTPIVPKEVIKDFHAPQNFMYADFDL